MIQFDPSLPLSYVQCNLFQLHREIVEGYSEQRGLLLSAKRLATPGWVIFQAYLCKCVRQLFYPPNLYQRESQTHTRVMSKIPKRVAIRLPPLYSNIHYKERIAINQKVCRLVGWVIYTHLACRYTWTMHVVPGSWGWWRLVNIVRVVVPFTIHFISGKIATHPPSFRIFQPSWNFPGFSSSSYLFSLSPLMMGRFRNRQTSRQTIRDPISPYRYCCYIMQCYKSPSGWNTLRRMPGTLTPIPLRCICLINTPTRELMADGGELGQQYFLPLQFISGMGHPEIIWQSWPPRI